MFLLFFFVKRSLVLQLSPSSTPNKLIHPYHIDELPLNRRTENDIFQTLTNCLYHLLLSEMSGPRVINFVEPKDLAQFLSGRGRSLFKVLKNKINTIK